MPIQKTDKGTYKIENVPGEHRTRRSAEKQLQAIKASQRRRSKK